MKVFKKIIVVVAALLLITWLSWKFIFAKPFNKAIDTYVYNLPYDTAQQYKVVQGYGGWFTHNCVAAIDFAMPEGTTILAARDGVVYAFKENSNQGGVLPKYKNQANYLMIKHDDGSFGCYWHLQQNSVLIKKGKVLKGQAIAKSGNTGQSLNPHLHFSVKTVLTYNSSSYIQTKFNTRNGIAILKDGQYY